MTKLSPKMWYLLKYGFLAIIAGGIFVSVLPLSKPEDVPDMLDLTRENFIESYIHINTEILREDVTECITKGISPEDEVGTGITREISGYNESRRNVGTKDIDFDASVFTVLTSFNNLLSILGIRAAIIEPSVLYCTLLTKYQEILLRRNFNISDFSKSENIFTYAVMQQDAVILQEEENIQRFTGLDFDPYFVQHDLADWMQMEIHQFEFEKFPSHIFYKHNLYTIHIVVFYERSNFLWHADLSTEAGENFPTKDKLLFAAHDGAYEKFAFMSLENRVPPVAEFYVPSNTHYFLFEMITSRFLECDVTQAALIHSTKLPKSHPGMSVKRFNRRTRVALRELKAIFHPLLMNFWLWSGTMLGWYRQCDIIPYTTDVDFGAWASEVEDLDVIINSLLNNKYVKIKQRMGLLEEALEFYLDCHGLRTDVFFVYQVKNGTWYSGHSPKLGYYFRYFLPNFTICSAELLGEKVQVPCEAEKVIARDYGPGWSKPAATWNYESSSKNRGPNIYWAEKMLKNAYCVY